MSILNENQALNARGHIHDLAGRFTVIKGKSDFLVALVQESEISEARKERGLLLISKITEQIEKGMSDLQELRDFLVGKEK